MDNTNKSLFREKSLEKISSPEQLTDYIRVSNPGVWMMLAAVIVLLAGACVWGIFGRLQTKLDVAAVSDGEAITCFVPEDDINSVAVGMPIVINDVEYSISFIPEEPSVMNADSQSYILHVGNLQVGEWVYRVRADSVIDVGIYDAKIITDSISPMSFVFN